LSVLYLLGLVQILCYTGAMRLLMGSPFVPGHVGTLAVYLLLMLGLGQLTVLFDAGHRLYFSLLVLLVMGIAGGVFFQLPEKILTGIGQYVPHGWALTRIREGVVLPVWIPGALGFLLLAARPPLQRRQVRRLKE